jgi:type VI secretion system secreted protein Hcp
MKKTERPALRFWQVFMMALTLILAPCGASAALLVYMTATGETQGEIKGGVNQAGREDSMAITEFGHGVGAPVDSASGLPSGKRQHRPIRVTKEIDKATPILLNVLTNNETLTSVTFRFFRPSSSGAEQQYYTVELVNAHIVNINQSNQTRLPPNWDDVPAPALETLTLVYEKIIWTWEDGGIIAEDNWQSPAR